MSEIQTNPKDHDEFIKKAAAAAAAVGIATIGLSAAGVYAQKERNQDIAQQVHDAEEAKVAAYNNSIEAAINTTYDSAAVIGEINVTQDSTLIDPAESIIEAAVGSDAYTDVKARIYSPLLDSAQAHNPQPGEKYSVVEVDINPEQADGTEYIVVDSEHISGTPAA